MSSFPRSKRETARILFASELSISGLRACSSIIGRSKTRFSDLSSRFVALTPKCVQMRPICIPPYRIHVCDFQTSVDGMMFVIWEWLYSFVYYWTNLEPDWVERDTLANVICKSECMQLLCTYVPNKFCIDIGESYINNFPIFWSTPSYYIFL